MMSEWLSQLRLRLRTLFRRRQLDQDLDDELAFHLAMREEKLGNASGARKAFGSVVATKETTRELWMLPWFESIWSDLCYGVRVLRKNPLFTTVAICSLALAIGANTAVFTLINAVMLEKLPVPSPDELVILNWSSKQRKGIMLNNAFGSRDRETGVDTYNCFDYEAFERFRDRSSQIADVFAFTPLLGAAVRVGAETELVTGLLASGGYYQGLRARPLIGRLLNDADDSFGAEPVAVLSHRFWQESFNGDPQVVGRLTTVNGVPTMIIGVTEPPFYGTSVGGFLRAPDVTLPLATLPEVEPRLGDRSLFQDGHVWWLSVMGRLQPGATTASARTELTALFGQAIAEAQVEAEGMEVKVLPGARGIDSLRQSLSAPLWTLMAATALVLLIACTNLATLMLARATARRSEITVRLAMGAGRWRLIRQLLTESLLLSVTAGVIGAVLSYWGCRALLGWIWRDSLPVSLAPDLRLLGFLVGLSVLAGLLFGLAPAFRASRVHLIPALKEGTGAAFGSGRREHAGRLGQGLIVLQVALSLVLIVGAGLFLRTLQNLRNVDVGFRSDGILLFGIDPTLARYEGDRLLSFYRNLQARLSATPGVLSATSSQLRLMTGGMSGGPAVIPGATWLENSSLQVHVNNVGPRYFDTMGIPIVLGRGPNERDTADAPRAVFINEAVVKEAFREGSPLGKTIHLWGEDEPPAEVVGVVADARYTDVRREPPPTVYAPYEQSRWGVSNLNFAIRTAGPPEAFAGTLRAVVRELDPNLPLMDVATQQRLIDERLRNERMFANLSTAFGVLALLLASIGIYGVVAYAVERRTGEFGIRMALGARTGSILWLVLRRTTLLVMIGVTAGLAGSYWLSKLITGGLYGVEAGDPSVLAGAAVLLLLVALAAGLVPARRAARVHPMEALRCE